MARSTIHGGRHGSNHAHTWRLGPRLPAEAGGRAGVCAGRPPLRGAAGPADMRSMVGCVRTRRGAPGRGGILRGVADTSCTLDRCDGGPQQRARIACACCACPCCAYSVLCVPLLCIPVLRAFVLGVWCSIRLDRAHFARPSRQHCGGAPARALCWRCACLRCCACVSHARVACTRYVCACCACLRFCALAFPMLALWRLRFPCSRCVHLLCVPLLCVPALCAFVWCVVYLCSARLHRAALVDVADITSLEDPGDLTCHSDDLTHALTHSQ